MTRTFNAFEAFEIAEQIERNGARFYRKAAEMFDDARVSGLFLKLAEWEKVHEELFADMRKQLSEQGRRLRTFDPQDAPLDAKAMAGLAAFGLNPDPSGELHGAESRQDVLKMAVQKEKDSIVYYTGLKGFVPPDAGRDKIDDVIKEELRHIGILNQALEQCE
jgi:rubrerythrin